MPNRAVEQYRVNPSGSSSMNDKRRKLTDADRADIQLKRKSGWSMRRLARFFCVSRRTIQFVCYPERLDRNLEARRDRGGSMRYYKKSKHAAYMRDHRAHKSKLMSQEKSQQTP